jgi:hypothetical protein
MFKNSSFNLKCKIMSLFKLILVGAAVGYGINYLTKKGANGRSVMDDITENAPDWLDQAKKFAQDNIGSVVEQAQAKRH